MKRSITLLLVLALVAALFAGCGGATPAAPAAPAAPGADAPAGGGETLVIAARGGVHVTAIESVKAQFEAEHNVTIEILGLEAADLRRNVVLDSLNNAGAYDLAMADDPWMPEFLEAGIFLNLNAAGIADDPDFIPASIALGKDPYGVGDTYALPFAGNVQFFFYNEELFAANNIDVPTDWSGVLAAARALNALDGVAGYVIRGQQGNPIVSDFLPVLWAHGANVFDDNWNVTVDSPDAIAALELYMTLLSYGVNFEMSDLVAAVSDGNAGMALGWPSWFIAGTDARAAYAPIPTRVNPGSPSHATGMIGHWMMGVTANSTNPDLALAFLQFITSAETQKQMAAAGGVPTRTSVLTDPALVENFPHFPTLLDGIINSMARPRTNLWPEVEDAFGVELSAAVSGLKSAEQALTDARVAIEQIMAR